MKPKAAPSKKSSCEFVWVILVSASGLSGSAQANEWPNRAFNWGLNFNIYNIFYLKSIFLVC